MWIFFSCLRHFSLEWNEITLLQRCLRRLHEKRNTKKDRISCYFSPDAFWYRKNRISFQWRPTVTAWLLLFPFFFFAFSNGNCSILFMQYEYPVFVHNLKCSNSKVKCERIQIIWLAQRQEQPIKIYQNGEKKAQPTLPFSDASAVYLWNDGKCDFKLIKWI